MRRKGLQPAGDGIYATADLAAVRDRGPRRHPGAARLRRHSARDRLHRARRGPLVSGEHGAHVVEIIEKGYLAAKTGVTQDLESRF